MLRAWKTALSMTYPVLFKQLLKKSAIIRQICVIRVLFLIDEIRENSMQKRIFVTIIV